MRKRLIEKWLKLATPLILISGTGAAVAVVISPYDLPATTDLQPIVAAASAKPLPSITSLQQSLDRRLFSEKTVQPVVVRKQPKPVVRWPQIELDCIFIGKNKKLAVFKGNNQTFVKSEGEKFMQVSVQRIAAGEVEVKFNGDSKTFLTASKNSASSGSKP